MLFDWLQRFDEIISHTAGRNFALFVDNCSALGSVETLPELRSVTVLSLPPNTTSKVQPMDAGVIAAIKLRYRLMHTERDVDMVDECDGKRKFSKKDVLTMLTAMQTLRTVWQNLPPDIIENCWKHPKVSPAPA